MMHRYDRIPELAGLATYAQAARIGFSVDENVRRLTRLHWAERRLMHVLLAHLTSTPVWEVKCAMALHQWQCAECADAIRRRIAEMRHPAPALSTAPDAALDRFLEEVLRSRGVVELVAGVYGVAFPALLSAYNGHVARTNPLVDHPTRRLMRLAVPELEDAVRWGALALDALLSGDDGAREAANTWQGHLTAYLRAAGGIVGERDDTPAGDAPALPPARSAQPFEPDFTPARDERFHGLYNFEFPPHDVYNAPGVPAAERNLALLCKRTLEMDVPEMMASFMVERAEEPWEFHLDYSRQLWDEARHAMMGTVALEARGVDWRAIPFNVGFSLRLNRHATPLERQIMLYGIEQSLMAAATGKRFEYETTVAAGDALSAHFHDYDWADEVLHAQIGRSALKRDGLTRRDAMERAEAIHARTWKALEQYRSREKQDGSWWMELVRTTVRQ